MAIQVLGMSILGHIEGRGVEEILAGGTDGAPAATVPHRPDASRGWTTHIAIGRLRCRSMHRSEYLLSRFWVSQLGGGWHEGEHRFRSAGVAQLAEHLLPKQRVAGSNPVSRSNDPQIYGQAPM